MGSYIVMVGKLMQKRTIPGILRYFASKIESRRVAAHVTVNPCSLGKSYVHFMNPCR